MSKRRPKVGERVRIMPDKKLIGDIVATTGGGPTIYTVRVVIYGMSHTTDQTWHRFYSKLKRARSSRYEWLGINCEAELRVSRVNTT